MAKFRCSLNWAAQYNSNKQGYASALELYPFVRAETTPGTLNPPQSGSQGVSTSSNLSVTDISAIADNKFNINIDGEGIVEVTLLNTATTGALIAAELETKINSAYEAANKDGRVWVRYFSSCYEIYSQTTGSNSKVVCTDAISNNLADDLDLGIANGGIEDDGTDSNDWIYVTSAGVNFSQEFEKSAHRSGRQATSIYRKKKMVEGSFEMYCLLGQANSTDIYMPNAMKSVLTSAFGNLSYDENDLAVFDMKQPHATYLSILTANNVFSQATNGAYIKTWNLECPGDDAAKITMDLKARDSKISVPAKIQTGTTLAVVSLIAGEEFRFEEGSLVMICSPDGRTISEGFDGTLKVVSTGTSQVTLNRSVTTETSGFLVPYYPLFGYNIPADKAQISTDLTGYVSFDGGVSQVDTVTACSVSVDPQLTDLDGYYGADGNRGFVDSSRTNITVSVTMHLTAQQAGLILKAKKFTEFSMKILVGFPDGQKMVVECPKVIFKVPAVEIPEDGPVEVTLEGEALQTLSGQMDAIKVSFMAV